MAAGLAISLCSMEIVPGWGGFRLGWPPEAYYAIVAAIAAFAGAVAVRGYPIPGLFGGSVSGMGALAATTWHLTQVSETWSLFMVIAGVLGALPGIGLFFVLKRSQDSIWPVALWESSIRANHGTSDNLDHTRLGAETGFAVEQDVIE